MKIFNFYNLRRICAITWACFRNVSFYSFRDYNFFWVPVVGPHIGAILGAFLYQLCVGFHWPSDDSKDIEETIHDKGRENQKNQGPTISKLLLSSTYNI